MAGKAAIGKLVLLLVAITKVSCNTECDGGKLVA